VYIVLSSLWVAQTCSTACCCLDYASHCSLHSKSYRHYGALIFKGVICILLSSSWVAQPCGTACCGLDYASHFSLYSKSHHHQGALIFKGRVHSPVIFMGRSNLWHRLLRIWFQKLRTGLRPASLSCKPFFQELELRPSR